MGNGKELWTFSSKVFSSTSAFKAPNVRETLQKTDGKNFCYKYPILRYILRKYSIYTEALGEKK